jgi:hypothetical protein
MRLSSAIEPDRDGSKVRFRLWVVGEIRGSRSKIMLGGDREGLAEELVFLLWMVDGVAREVVIEEELRPARRRRVMKAWPVAPTVHGGVLRSRVRVEPQKKVQTGYVVEYRF